jgi:choline dehydrogenase-like flavoprotein
LARFNVMANQWGTCRFGEYPKTSVLDMNCRTLDNALRVGEHIERLRDREDSPP